MTTSPTLSLSELADIEQAVPLGTLAYLRERTRARIYDYVMSKFLQQEGRGLTQAKLARRIKRDPAVLNRWFANPGNWTIDAISDLLAGISAEELEPASASLLNRPLRNDTRPRWLESVGASQGFPHPAPLKAQPKTPQPTIEYAPLNRA